MCPTRESAQCPRDEPGLLLWSPRQPPELTLSNLEASTPEHAHHCTVPHPTSSPQQSCSLTLALLSTFLHLAQSFPGAKLVSLICSETFSCFLWAFKVKSKGLMAQLLCLHTASSGLKAHTGLFSLLPHTGSSFPPRSLTLPLPRPYHPGAEQDLGTLGSANDSSGYCCAPQ